MLQGVPCLTLAGKEKEPIFLTSPFCLVLPEGTYFLCDPFLPYLWRSYFGIWINFKSNYIWFVHILIPSDTNSAFNWTFILLFLHERGVSKRNGLEHRFDFSWPTAIIKLKINTVSHCQILWKLYQTIKNGPIFVSAKVVDGRSVRFYGSTAGSWCLLLLWRTEGGNRCHSNRARTIMDKRRRRKMSRQGLISMDEEKLAAEREEYEEWMRNEERRKKHRLIGNIAPFFIAISIFFNIGVAVFDNALALNQAEKTVDGTIKTKNWMNNLQSELNWLYFILFSEYWFLVYLSKIDSLHSKFSFSTQISEMPGLCCKRKPRKIINSIQVIRNKSISLAVSHQTFANHVHSYWFYTEFMKKFWCIPFTDWLKRYYG